MKIQIIDDREKTLNYIEIMEEIDLFSYEYESMESTITNQQERLINFISKAKAYDIEKVVNGLSLKQNGGLKKQMNKIILSCDCYQLIQKFTNSFLGITLSCSYVSEETARLYYTIRYC